MESSKIQELIEGILNILPQNTKEMKNDLKDNLKILLNDYLRKIDVVTREEFDIQKEVLLKTREKLDDLEKKFKK
jgi:BMFP domain-containing protein YqiC